MDLSEGSSVSPVYLLLGTNDDKQLLQVISPCGPLTCFDLIILILDPWLPAPKKTHGHILKWVSLKLEGIPNGNFTRENGDSPLKFFPVIKQSQTEHPLLPDWSIIRHGARRPDFPVFYRGRSGAVSDRKPEREDWRPAQGVRILWDEIEMWDDL